MTISKTSPRSAVSLLALCAGFGLAACGGGDTGEAARDPVTAPVSASEAAPATSSPGPAMMEATTPEGGAAADAAGDTATINPDAWPAIETAPLDPAIEARVDEILAVMTVPQKVGQIIQADSGSVTPEEVKEYRLGSVLSGGNSAPGGKPYADTATWLAAADAHYEASVDPDGVEIAIPIIWGIDAVHGHANLTGATVFPHNIGLGAANDPDLIERIAQTTAEELTVSGHDWTFAPTLAVPQNDRWGRTYEGFSENPDIVRDYGGRIVVGLQGKVGTDGFMGPGRVISSAKHFVGDGGTTNGIDQGDAQISEAELRDIHAAGYETAVAEGVQTVMASFSAWQGQRMHGQKELMTDVLKGRMNFRGFIVGDWNGHGLVPGCTATDCPQAVNAGLDMFMAPDSWKGLYESTLGHVEDGTIPMERLDDAVRRILRVKLASGVFEKGKPSARPLAGEDSLLGSDEHRALAREAVRKSMVLLKNQGGILPLPADATIIVTGDGADSITKTAGGWTLSWQGGGYANDEFPNGQSILAAIRETVEAEGGTVVFDPDGTSTANADAVIAVYGEDPYAEFQGDRENVDFTPTGWDTGRLAGFADRGVPVVSVFLSGRPLFVNPEINASDAFVAAWLPGTEGGGVADLLFQTDPSFDFTGRLSYSWPKLATQAVLDERQEDYDPLFAYGYGLSYDDDGDLPTLDEESGLAEGGSGAKGEFFVRGAAQNPWMVMAGGSAIDALPYDGEAVSVAKTDNAAQEDSLLVTFKGDEPLIIGSSYALDFSRESVAAMELTFEAKLMDGAGDVTVGMGCEGDDCEASIPVSLSGDWSEYRLSLSCFANEGVAMDRLKQAMILSGQAGTVMGLGNVRIETDTDGAVDCGR